MKILFGRDPTPPKPRPWATAMGFSGAEWLDHDGFVLDQTPEIGRQYIIRLPGNFVADDGSCATFFWLPADSTLNGFDESNAKELPELRFVTGKISTCKDQDRTILFNPESIESPKHMLTLESKAVCETNTLMDCQREFDSFERFTCISFSMEGDVTSRYVFLDEHLVMLEHNVFDDAYFWIGKGKLSQQLEQKILLVEG